MPQGTPGAALSGDTPAGVLLILPDAGAGTSIPAGLVLIGLPLVWRIARAAERAGFEQVLVVGADDEMRGLLDGTTAMPLDEPPAAVRPNGQPPGDRRAVAPRARGRVVLLSSRVVPQADWLRSLRTMPLPPGRAHRDGAVAAALDADDPAEVVARAARSGGVGAALATLPPDARAAGPPPSGRFVLDDRSDVGRAEWWMLESLVKPSEGFMSRHFERRLSLRLTRRLARTRVTPNAVTLVSLAIGFGAAPCFLSPRPSVQIAGALLFLLHSILDGCDGELARLKYLQSRLGALLDFWGDNLVHIAVFGGMAVGWSRAVGAPWPLYLGALAVVGTLVAAARLHRSQVSPGAGSDGHGAGRLVDWLAHRDFIYLILVLACWGRAWWFLPLAAAGIPLFLLALAWADRARGRAGRA